MTDQTKAPELTEKQKLCLNCQRCCRQVNILTAYSSDNEEIKKFFATRGFKVYDAAISENKDDKRILLTLEYPCPFLTPLGCAIYATRPEICKAYDGTLDNTVDCAWRSLDESKTTTQ